MKLKEAIAIFELMTHSTHPISRDLINEAWAVIKENLKDKLQDDCPHTRTFISDIDHNQYCNDCNKLVNWRNAFVDHK